MESCGSGNNNMGDRRRLLIVRINSDNLTTADLRISSRRLIATAKEASPKLFRSLAQTDLRLIL